MGKEEALRMLRAKQCRRWPECDCYATLLLWAANLQDEGTTWEPEELEWAQTTIFLSLACMTKRCPDERMKAYAREQLKDRYWDRQKGLGIWAEH
jgi:hypothetical protein